MTDLSPRRPLSLALVLVSLSTAFLTYWEYSREFYSGIAIWDGVLRGQAGAPAQYRIGVVRTAQWLAMHAHFGVRHALGIIDLVTALIACFVLRSLLLRSAAWRTASLPVQWFGAAAFVALLQYALWWIIWYQRPETLAITALLALSLWLSSHRLPVSGTAGSLLNTLLLIVAGAAQGTIRADVGVAFNLGIAILCLVPFTEKDRAHGFALPRFAQCAASLAAAAAAAGVQLYLMHVVYPQATYGSTSEFQLKLNFTDHLRIVPFVLFLTPCFWLGAQVIKRRVRPSPPQAGLLLGAAFFMCLWIVLGKIDEVRIFLPFAFAFAPLTVEAAMLRAAPPPR